MDFFSSERRDPRASATVGAILIYTRAFKPTDTVRLTFIKTSVMAVKRLMSYFIVSGSTHAYPLDLFISFRGRGGYLVICEFAIWWRVV